MANPIINGTDLEKAIAKSSSLTQMQAKELFRALGEVIESLAESPNTPPNLEVVVPHIGKFKIKKKKPSPSLYRADWFQCTYEEYCDMEYNELSLDVGNALQKRIKDITREQYRIHRESEKKRASLSEKHGSVSDELGNKT